MGRDANETSGSPGGMQVDWDAPITMDDGVVLRADVFRPTGTGKHPVNAERQPLNVSTAECDNSTPDQNRGTLDVH
jgi:predicted acyl esterase